jgi:hypothetical protein
MTVFVRVSCASANGWNERANSSDLAGWAFILVPNFARTGETKELVRTNGIFIAVVDTSSTLIRVRTNALVAKAIRTGEANTVVATLTGGTREWSSQTLINVTTDETRLLAIARRAGTSEASDIVGALGNARGCVASSIHCDIAVTGRAVSTFVNVPKLAVGNGLKAFGSVAVVALAGAGEANAVNAHGVSRAVVEFGSGALINISTLSAASLKARVAGANVARGNNVALGVFVTVAA